MENELDFADNRLHEAVRYSDIDDVRAALKEGYDPDQIGAYQWSALHEATSNGDIDIVRLLLRHGANPNHCDRLKGSTAVHYAASNGYDNILQLLLDKGGRYSVVNKDGQNALDVAVGIGCQKLLREQRNDDTTFTTPKEVILDNLRQDLQLQANNNNRNTQPNNNHNDTSIATPRSSSLASPRSSSLASPCSSIATPRSDDSSSVLSVDPDEISIATTNSYGRSHSRAWGPDKLLGLRKEQTLGSVQLSFEYNSKKRTFKIRVWQLFDLLMPPPTTSQISGIYVKSFLLPDDKKLSKQKTEEVKVVTPLPDPDAPQDDSMTGDFTPQSFSFKRALEYEDISRQVVSEKVIDLEVCVTQRYSRKSYVISYLSLPMHVACRRLVKEKFPLQPRIGSKLPENMKVYSAADWDSVTLRPKKKMSMSNPSLYWNNSYTSWGAVPYTERASSFTNLEGCTVERTASKVSKASSIEITVPNEEDEDLENALNQIAVMERAEKLAEESAIEMDTFEQIPGVTNLHSVEVKDPVNVADVLVHLPPKESTFTSRSKFLQSKCASSDSTSIQSSRPGTPSWDYYDETPSFSLIAIADIDDDLPPLPDTSKEGFDPMAPVLPIATSLELRSNIPEQIQSKNVPKKTDSEKRQSRKLRQKMEDVRAKTTEAVELSTFVDSRAELGSTETSIVEVHGQKTKQRQQVKGRVTRIDSTSRDTPSPLKERVSRKDSTSKDTPSQSRQKTEETERKRQSELDEESLIGDTVEMKTLTNPLKKEQSFEDEESCIGVFPKHQAKVVKETEKTEKLDLPVLHRKKRSRPKQN